MNGEGNQSRKPGWQNAVAIPNHLQELSEQKGNPVPAGQIRQMQPRQMQPAYRSAPQSMAPQSMAPQNTAFPEEDAYMGMYADESSMNSGAPKGGESPKDGGSKLKNIFRRFGGSAKQDKELDLFGEEDATELPLDAVDEPASFRVMRGGQDRTPEPFSGTDSISAFYMDTPASGPSAYGGSAARDDSAAYSRPTARGDHAARGNPAPKEPAPMGPVTFGDTPSGGRSFFGGINFTESPAAPEEKMFFQSREETPPSESTYDSGAKVYDTGDVYSDNSLHTIYTAIAEEESARAEKSAYSESKQRVLPQDRPEAQSLEDLKERIRSAQAAARGGATAEVPPAAQVSLRQERPEPQSVAPQPIPSQPMELSAESQAAHPGRKVPNAQAAVSAVQPVRVAMKSARGSQPVQTAPTQPKSQPKPAAPPAAPVPPVAAAQPTPAAQQVPPWPAMPTAPAAAPYGAYGVPYAYPYGYPMYPPAPMMPPPMQQQQPAGDGRTEYEKSASMRIVYQDGEEGESESAQQPQAQMPAYGGFYPPYYPAPVYPNPMLMQPPYMGYPAPNAYAPAMGMPAEQPAPATEEEAYLAGMDVVYESGETEVQEEEKEVLYIDTASIRDLYQDLAYTAKEPEMTEIGTDLSELFQEAEQASRRQKSGLNRFFKAALPGKGDSKKEVVRKVVMLVSWLLIIGSFSYVLNYYVIEPRSAVNGNHTVEPPAPPPGDLLGDPWPGIRAEHPDIVFPEGMLPEYAHSYAKNTDLRGWLRIPGFGISYPVVQTTDNSTYLTIDFLREKYKRGTLFFDARNTISRERPMDLNTTVYGHNMRTDNLMFGCLEKYRTIEGFQKASIIECDTIYAKYYWKVYAVFLSNGSRSSKVPKDEDYVFDYIFNRLSTGNDNQPFRDYIEELNRRRFYDTGVDIRKDDKILTLSTCAYDFTDARLVVVARMVRPGESHAVDITLAKLNPNPQYPQMYYDKKKLTNDYKHLDFWKPY